MSREWNRRILATLALLAVAELLKRLPIPGVPVEGIRAALEHAPPATVALAVGRLSLGALGISPYLGASVLVVLASTLRRMREPRVPGRLERTTLVVAFTLALLQGAALAVEFGTLLAGDVASGQPTTALYVATTLSVAAGTAATVAIAHAITRFGAGNGVVILVLVDGVRSYVGTLEGLAGEGLLDPGPTAFAALLTGGAALLLSRILQGRWSVPLPAAEPGGVVPGGRGVELRASTIGTSAVGLATSLVLVGVGVYLMLPPILAPRISVMLAGSTFARSIAVAVITVPLTLFFVAWAYDPSRLRGLLGKAGATLDATAFDRVLERLALPGLFLLPVAVGAWALAREGPLPALPEALTLVFVVAAAVSLAERGRLHERLAAGFDAADPEERCCSCDTMLASGVEFCPRCGHATGDRVRCHEHADREATAHCVFCATPLCADCAATEDGGHVCSTHRGIPVIEGWAAVARETTSVAAQLVAQELARAGLRAEIASTTVAPLAGTLGLYETTSLVPFLPCATLAGGAVAVLVPAPDYGRAVAVLEAPDADPSSLTPAASPA